MTQDAQGCGEGSGSLRAEQVQAPSQGSPSVVPSVQVPTGATRELSLKLMGPSPVGASESPLTGAQLACKLGPVFQSCLLS